MIPGYRWEKDKFSESSGIRDRQKALLPLLPYCLHQTNSGRLALPVWWGYRLWKEESNISQCWPHGNYFKMFVDWDGRRSHENWILVLTIISITGGKSPRFRFHICQNDGESWKLALTLSSHNSWAVCSHTVSPWFMPSGSTITRSPQISNGQIPKFKNS